MPLTVEEMIDWFAQSQTVAKFEDDVSCEDTAI